ncbi:MAG: tRNA preQ1(34) S-adenosylmethionine ribosyltransferase-isomerase QueA [Spirochaetaceae bacterium]
METDSFSFNLPQELIAQHPSKKRDESRLMLLQRDTPVAGIEHHRISDLPDLLPSNAVLILNDSRVRKARIYGTTEYGGEVEFLLLEERVPGEWKAVVSKAKRQKPGRSYRFPGSIEGKEVRGEISETEGEYRYIRFTPPISDEYLDTYGHIPLPPYISREDTGEDAERYQTVYAENTGSVAAPTAGLHLTDTLLEEIEKRGVAISRLTLHVGLGTFSPIRSDRIEDHHMHRERYRVPPQTAETVTEAKRQGRPVYALGTTSVRTLESAWDDEKGLLRSGEGETDLYILPGYKFKVVDGLLTNFHTPKSSLLVLVSAFAGKELIDKAYRTAVDNGYRFFSYGDAMLIR